MESERPWRFRCSDKEMFQPAAPSNFTYFDTQGPLLLASSGFSFRTRSRVSSAMFRYVVHFPPAMVTMPDLETEIWWLREIACVDPALGFLHNGRMPVQQASMSWYATGHSRYR